MNNYDKWDAIVDSDEENEKRQSRCKSYELEAAEGRRQLQAEIDSWLRRQINKLPRDGDPTTKRLHQSMPELARSAPTPIRAISKSEREVLAMLIAVSHFEEGDTNLDRHPLMLDLVRHHRWIEEDPGSLELLCRVHNHVMKEGEHGRHAMEDPEHQRMRDMVLSAINTVAAPKRAKCPGGLLELFTQICTPENEESRELRRKWQTKEYAKDALFDSLFPDLRQYADGNMDEDDGWGSDFWIIIVLGLLAVVGIIAFIVLYYNGVMTPSARSSKGAGNISNLSARSGAPAIDEHFGPGGAPASDATLPPPLASPPAPAPPAMKMACMDSNDSCPQWAQIGECTKNVDFMVATCRLSCGICQVAAPGAAPQAAPASSASSTGTDETRGQEL